MLVATETKANAISSVLSVAHTRKTMGKVVKAFATLRLLLASQTALKGRSLSHAWCTGTA